MFELAEVENFSDWLSDLKDAKAQALIARRLRRLAVSEHWGDAKDVGDGVIELRLFYGAGLRVYVTRSAGELIVLLGGGDKSSQTRDIARAKAAAKELSP